MDVLGLWKAGKIISPVEEDACFITVDVFNDLPDDYKDDLMKYLAKSYLDFKSDGDMTIYFELPEDELESAREEGFEIIDGKHALLNTLTWKEENGVIYYSSEEYGIDNMPTQFDEEGGIVINNIAIYYKD